MKKFIVISFVLSIIMSVLTGCSELKQEYSQLTSDDLSHLYFDRDSLVYDGTPVNYKDTIAFLHNSMDTLLVEVFTNVYDWQRPYWQLVYPLAGISKMYFSEDTGFSFAFAKIFKDGISTEILISFILLDGGCPDVKLDMALDTALVLGKNYNNVYKFEYPENSPTKLRKLYFAKKFGFIKVETTDGRTLERLDLSKGEIRALMPE